METIAQKLLVDTITQDYQIFDSGLRRECSVERFRTADFKSHIVETSRKPGVMDPIEQSVLKALSDIGINIDGVKTAQKYLINGDISPETISIIATRLLANTKIEDVFIYPEMPNYDHGNIHYSFKKKTIPLLNADNKQLEEISTRGQLSLNLQEMQSIQKYYQSIKREPTDVELETIAQTWSEHCVHKTFKGIIDFNGNKIDNLLKNTIMKATSELNKTWCVSVFKDNAGIIRFDDFHNICFKVETHNHPSAIEPYGGANTGIGGVIRDVMGTGLGGKPILNTDVFCFGLPDTPQDKIPKGVLHPKEFLRVLLRECEIMATAWVSPRQTALSFLMSGTLAIPSSFAELWALYQKTNVKKHLILTTSLSLLAAGQAVMVFMEPLSPRQSYMNNPNRYPEAPSR